MVPALTGTNRMADHDIMLGGYLIPKNTMIWCNLNALFSSPDVWHEPDKYIPVSVPYQPPSMSQGCFSAGNGILCDCPLPPTLKTLWIDRQRVVDSQQCS